MWYASNPGWRYCCAAQIVVAADDVKRGEHDVAFRPDGILAIERIAGIFALAEYLDLLRAEAFVGAEEGPALQG
jgi:hypothetical protein